MRSIVRFIPVVVLLTQVLPSSVWPQSKPLRELKVGYPLGGSSSYFWVSYRAGSFEKYGLKLEPIYIRGGLMGIQAALSGDLPLQLQGASTVVAAWAQGAKDFQIGRAHAELQSHVNLVCRLLLEKNKRTCGCC